MQYVDVVRADRPILFWPLWEGGGTALDYSGTGKDATYTGSPPLHGGSPLPGYPAPRFGSGMYASRSTTFALTQNVAGLGFAIEGWFVKRSHLAAQTGDINSLFGNINTAAAALAFRYDGTSTLRLYYSSDGGLKTLTVPAAFLPAHNRPYHIVGTVTRSGQSRVILNGQVVVEAATIGTSLHYDGAFSVAASPNESGTRCFDGSIGMVAMYDHPISLDTARRHYAVGIRGPVDHHARV